MIPPHILEILPATNAVLNGTSGVLLLIGLGLIKTNRIRLHATAMIAAFVCSAVFLACYLILHYNVPPKSPLVKGPIRIVYYSILLTHVILAVVILPMIITVFVYAIRRNWISHRRWAVWTFPLWLYVSVTGVIIYWMLYHLKPY